MENWIKELKVGDEVLVSGNRNESIATIDNITKCCIGICGDLFNKDNGRKRGSTIWDSKYICQLSHETKVRILLRQRRCMLKKSISGNIEELNDVKLERIYKIIKEK